MRKVVPISDAEAPARRGASLTGVFMAPDCLDALADDWRDLADNAVEKNPFYAPFMLGPALKHLPAGDVVVACVFEGARLVGLAPLQPMRGYARLPVRYVTTWMYEHCFFAAPLVRRGYEQAVFEALFRLVDAHPARPAFLRLRHIDADGPLARAARASAQKAGRTAFQAGDYARALLKCGYRAETYLTKIVSKKKRKEMGRLRRRLEEQGPVILRALSDRDDIDIWCTMFLALESAGWKGREGSAIASSARATRFFREAVKGAFEANALQAYRLDAGEDTIAMIVNFIARGEGYSFKIAHDPAYARFSPGVMLEVDMLKALASGRAARFVDSCASADHSMINSLWAARRTITGLNVSGQRLRDRALLGACRALETARVRLAGVKVVRP